MRLVITFLAMLALNCVFLAFRDTSQLMEIAPATGEITEANIEYMQKYKWVYENHYYRMFAFTDTKVPLAYWTYHVSTHITILVLVLIAAEMAKLSYQRYINAFLTIQILDFADFILVNNEKWGNSNVTFNIVAPFLFGAFCIYIYFKDGERNL